MNTHISRRRFLAASATASAAISMPNLLLANKESKQLSIGQGEHKFEVQHGWAQLPSRYTWQTTHNVAVDAEGLLYVIHEGQIGHEMYFINHGEVQVFSRKDNKIIENMESGSFFGELALLDSVRRTASVKTLTYCELFVLEKSDFSQVMADYPNFADKIEEIAEKRRQENQSDSIG